MHRKIVLFSQGTPPAYRRRRWLFLAVWIWVAIMVASPLFVVMGKARPLVLGLPAGLVWVISAVALIFVALLALYASEDPEPDEADGERASQAPDTHTPTHSDLGRP